MDTQAPPPLSLIALTLPQKSAMLPRVLAQASPRPFVKLASAHPVPSLATTAAPLTADFSPEQAPRPGQPSATRAHPPTGAPSERSSAAREARLIAHFTAVTQPQTEAKQSAHTAHLLPALFSSELSPDSRPEEPGDTITLVYKDGRPSEQIHNFLLSRTTLSIWDKDRDRRYRNIPVDELDLAATEKANREAGVDFALPAAEQ